MDDSVQSGAGGAARINTSERSALTLVVWGLVVKIAVVLICMSAPAHAGQTGDLQARIDAAEPVGFTELHSEFNLVSSPQFVSLFQLPR